MPGNDTVSTYAAPVILEGDQVSGIINRIGADLEYQFGEDDNGSVTYNLIEKSSRFIENSRNGSVSIHGGELNVLADSDYAIYAQNTKEGSISIAMADGIYMSATASNEGIHNGGNSSLTMASENGNITLSMGGYLGINNSGNSTTSFQAENGEFYFGMSALKDDTNKTLIGIRNTTSNSSVTGADTARFDVSANRATFLTEAGNVKSVIGLENNITSDNSTAEMNISGTTGVNIMTIAEKADQVFGVFNEKGNVSLEADNGSVEIISKAESSSSVFGNGVIGIYNQVVNNWIDKEVTGKVSVNALQDVTVTSTVDGNGSAYGILNDVRNSGGKASGIIDIVAGGKIDIKAAGQRAYGISNNNEIKDNREKITETYLSGSKVTIAAEGRTEAYGVKSSSNNGIYDTGSDTTIHGENGVEIFALLKEEASYGSASGIYSRSQNKGSTTEVTGKTISIAARSDSDNVNFVYGVQGQYYGAAAGADAVDNDIVLKANENITISASANGAGSFTYGVLSGGGADIDVASENGKVIIAGTYAGEEKKNVYGYGIYTGSATGVEGKISVSGKLGTEITGSYAGVWANGQDSVVEVTSSDGMNRIDAGSYGIFAGDSINKTSGASVELKGQGNQITSGATAIRTVAKGDEATVTADTNSNYLKGVTGIWSTDGSYASLSAEQGANVIEMSGHTIFATGADTAVELTAVNNYLTGGNTAVLVYNYADSTMTASAGSNIVKSGTLTTQGNIEYGDGMALDISNYGSVLLDAAESNVLEGGIHATNYGEVSLTGKSNAVYSSSTRATGDLADGTYTAVYAAMGSNVKIEAEDGGVNYISSYVASSEGTEEQVDEHERTVWASKGSTIDLIGTTVVTASLAGKSSNDNYSNSTGIALAAGTDDWGTTTPDFGREITTWVNMKYGADSVIDGDVVAGYGGGVNITPQDNGSLAIGGNVFAGNGGEVTLNLGDGSYWVGRADDYHDVGSESDYSHDEIFAPEFSNGVQAAGTVSVDLGSDSYWNVTGQSWVTDLTGDGSVIDLRGNETGGYALHVHNLSGSNTFIMNVAKSETGDMLYVTNGTTAGQNLVIANREEVLSTMDVGDMIRFATVENAGGGGFTETEMPVFGRSTRILDAGINNVTFSIQYQDVATDPNKGDDVIYNGGTGENGINESKPGDSYVQDNYEGADDAQNIYIVREDVQPGDESDAGRTILNMSRANYKNAVYMDRLNKRLGEARYIDGEEGAWFRVRHDRIGLDNTFRSQNTMFELGWDIERSVDSGEHRRGIALDYMEGSTSYTDIWGEGETKRAGLWFYDTWLGEKGHYSDYIVKWGYLENSFDIYSKVTGENITGDYNNNVFSISAEYGRKKALGGSWYIEPQVQMQLARVTGADYTTSQGSRVKVDGIDSLIGRVGFRLGKDVSESSTVYFKADVLHEFLGDQSVTAWDSTGSLWKEYENSGTWYDVGIGFSKKFENDFYIYLDAEHSFGNDNDDTYQINGGIRFAFN